jgi:hypothetical protein
VSHGGGLLTQVLHPILDTYLNSAVGVTGCHSYGLAREGCEYDVVVVSVESRPKASVKIGAAYVDLFFMAEKDILSPADPEIAVSFATMVPVRDNSLTFSTGSSAAKAVLQENLDKASESRLAKSLKALVRADEALSKSRRSDANFWLDTAGYDFAYAWLYASGVAPAPSHLLSQLKALSHKSSEKYVAFSRAVGLERASRRACEDRLDAISVVQDAVTASESPEPEGMDSASARTALEIVRAKAGFMTDSIMHVDCYSFLGLVLCSVLPELSLVHSRASGTDVEQSGLVSTLSEGDHKMVGERVVRGLGLERGASTVEAGVDVLRTEVSNLAREI